MAKSKGPQFLDYTIPLINVLKENGGSGNASEIIDKVIEKLSIPDNIVAEILPSGESRVRNRIQWARFYLAKAGLIDTQKRGQWQLTQEGYDIIITGQSGDMGIDGIGLIKLNDVVNFNIVFQCKRYKEIVGPHHIRDFRGAMQGRADKGLMISTGRFTQEAKKEASRDGVPPIELIDGEKLVTLFEKYKLGLKPVIVYEIIPEFFKNFD